MSRGGRAVRGLLVPTLPGTPRLTRAYVDDGVVAGMGMAEPVDTTAGWRMYRRFYRQRPGTVNGLRANAVATVLLRDVDPEAGLVFEPVVIVGRGGDGSLTDIPPLLVRKAMRLWRRLPHPRRLTRSPYLPPRPAVTEPRLEPLSESS